MLRQIGPGLLGRLHLALRPDYCSKPFFSPQWSQIPKLSATLHAVLAGQVLRDVQADLAALILVGVDQRNFAISWLTLDCYLRLLPDNAMNAQSTPAHFPPSSFGFLIAVHIPGESLHARVGSIALSSEQQILSQ